MTKLSIVIVAYKNMDCLADCLASIPLLPWIEVVVVNNTHQNRGFGAGCNVGFSQTSGEYVLFLNPDCLVTETALRQLLTILKKDESIGVLGPQLTNKDGVPYLSCNRPASRWLAPWVYSVFNSWLSFVPRIAGYWYHHQPPAQATNVGSCCGAALIMRRKVFEEVGGFDEDYFLYWEEFDLQKRISNAGYRVVFDPHASLVHIGELSTLESRALIMRWFRQSRHLFFKKHFGLTYAALLEGWFTCLEEWRLLVASGLLLGAAWILYEKMWWLQFSQIWMWEAGNFTKLVTVDAGYWLSVVGAVMGMIAFYNEISIKRKTVAAGLSLVIGIVLLLGAPIGFVVTLIAGLGWATIDLLSKNDTWRKRIVWLNVIGGVGLATWFGVEALRNPMAVSPSNWRGAAHVIARYGKSGVALRCVGCDESKTLLPLTFLLERNGVKVQDDYPTVYVLVPPFSTYVGRIPDTYTYQFDSISVAIPLAQP